MEGNKIKSSYVESQMNENDDEKKKLIDKADNEDEFVKILPSNLKIFNIFELIFAYISLFAINHPKLSCVTVFINLVTIALIINGNIYNAPPDVSKIIENDYSGTRSKYDLHAGTIDHWCLGGGDGGCQCEDPLTPSEKRAQIWSKAVDENWYDVQTALNYWGEEKGSIDVVFLGSNIVEYWKGRTIGRSTSNFSEEVSQKFKKVFEDGKIKALPLGIAGDTVPNILWRLQNGEMPNNLRPKLWWLIIGNNDIAIRQCSEEVVLIGILRIVEEILYNQPDARIVINSLLPMTSNQKGYAHKIKFSNVKKFEHLTRREGVAEVDDIKEEVKTKEAYEVKEEADEQRRRLKGGDDDNQDTEKNAVQENKWKDWEPTEEQKKKWKKWEPTEEQREKRRSKENDEARKQDTNEDGETLTKNKEQKKKWTLKWGIKVNEKLEDNDTSKGGTKQKKKWKWGGNKDTEKKTVDDEIGNEYYATTTGEMKSVLDSSISLWHSVVAINRALEKFCWSNKKVTFFDASEIFIEDHKIDTDLMLSLDGGQPSVAGHHELLLAVQQKVKDLLHASAKKNEKQKKNTKVRSKKVANGDD